MPDRRQARFGAQLRLRRHLARLDRQQRQIGSHRLAIENVAACVGMGANPAIGDDQKAPVRRQREIVRSDAARGPFADPGEAAPRVVDADRPVPGRESVLGGEEARAIGAEGAVAVEMAAGGRRERRFGRKRRCVERQGVDTGPTRDDSATRTCAPG